MKITLGVIFGGDTVEHEVSIITACQAMEHLNPDKYEIIPIYIGKDKTWYTGKMLMDINIYKDFDNLKKYAKKCVMYRKDGTVVLQSTGLFKRTITELDLAFPMVHGNNVEDGSLAGFLEIIGIPYVGSNVLGGALGQDKVVMKQVFAKENIPIVDYLWFFDNEYFGHENDIVKNVKKLGYPVIVKPATLGSSVGISFVKDESALTKAIEEAIKYDNKIIVEKAVTNLVEVNCSVLGNYEDQQTSKIVQMNVKSDFLTYSDKYLNGGKKKASTGKGMASSEFKVAPHLDEKIEKEVEELSKKTFRVLNLSGIARIDFLIDDKHKKVYVNEPNTIPGSLAFYMWEPAGKPYTELLDDAINLAIRDFKAKNKKVSSFETNILTNFNGLKGKKMMK